MQCLYPLPDFKILDLFNLKAFANDEIDATSTLKYVLEGWKTLWKN